MTWQGFIKESKSYMNYPTDKQSLDKSNLVGGKTVKERKIIFWKKFPRACIRFYWYTIKDFIKYKVYYGRFK